MLARRRLRRQNSADVRQTAPNPCGAPHGPPGAAPTAQDGPPAQNGAAADAAPEGAAPKAAAAAARDDDARSRERARRDGLSLGVAGGLSWIAFGAAAVTAGLSVPQACVLSLLAFTGASQYALAAAVAGGGSLLAGTLGALVLGSRNALYGLRLAGVLRVRGGRRLLAAHAGIDETTAMALAQPGPGAARTGLAATFGALYAGLDASTPAGALRAGRLGRPATFRLHVIGPPALLPPLSPRPAPPPSPRRGGGPGGALSHPRPPPPSSGGSGSAGAGAAALA